MHEELHDPQETFVAELPVMDRILANKELHLLLDFDGGLDEVKNKVRVLRARAVVAEFNWVEFGARNHCHL
jgi:hypothetical protein